MNLAGLLEWVLGNSAYAQNSLAWAKLTTVTPAFPMAVFIVYGSHWCNLAYQTDSVHGVIATYGATGAESVGYNSGQAMYNVVMLVAMSFAARVCSTRMC